MKRESLAAVIFLALFCFVACTGTPDTVSKATPAKPVVLPKPGKSYQVVGIVKGIKKYVVRYSNGMYRGGDIFSEEGMKALAALKVKQIIAVTPTPLEVSLAAKYKIILVKMPFSKKTGVSKKDLFRLLAEAKNKKTLYVHCHGGSHRAGILCMALRLYADNWDYRKAEKEFLALGGSLEKDSIMLKSIRNFRQ